MVTGFYIAGSVSGFSAVSFIVALLIFHASDRKVNIYIVDLEDALLASDNELARRKTDLPDFAINDLMLFCGNDRAKVHFMVLWIKENWHRFTQPEKFMIQRNARYIINANANIDNYEDVRNLWKKVFDFTYEVKI